MIFERINLNIDHQRLAREVLERIAGKEPRMYPASMGQTFPSFGGWSLTSSNGSWMNGWERALDCVVKDNSGNLISFNYALAAKLNVSHEWSHSKPTEICNGYLLEIINQIDSLGFYPRRARISLIKAGGQSSKHRDTVRAEYEYRARLHIPIITNPGATFWCEEGEVHMPADGHAYIIWVNKLHQVFNRSNEDRLHLIMSVWDTKHVTKEFGCSESIAEEQEQAMLNYNKKIEAVRNQS